MSLTLALTQLKAARDEFRKAQDSEPEDMRGRLTVLETEADHVLDLAQRYLKDRIKANA